LLELAQMLFPNPAERRTLFCDTPRRLFGFGDSRRIVMTMRSASSN
jgi:hypothetical protein